MHTRQRCIASTIIGEGTKIDNQVHIGHDTVIGNNCLIASGAGISGCVVIENGVKIWEVDAQVMSALA